LLTHRIREQAHSYKSSARSTIRDTSNHCGSELAREGILSAAACIADPPHS
jgi:hypothetical protein